MKWKTNKVRILLWKDKLNKIFQINWDKKKIRNKSVSNDAIKRQTG